MMKHTYLIPESARTIFVVNAKLPPPAVGRHGEDAEEEKKGRPLAEVTIVRYRDILISRYKAASLLVPPKLVDVSIFESGRMSEIGLEIHRLVVDKPLCKRTRACECF